MTSIKLRKSLLNFSIKEMIKFIVEELLEVQGDLLEIFPSHLEDRSWRISFFGESIESIDEFDPFLGSVSKNLEEITIFANSHYVTPKPSLVNAITQIKSELDERIKFFESKKLFLEAQRIEQKNKI